MDHNFWLDRWQKQEIAEISREALGDISRVNQERKDRIRLLDS